MIHLYWLGFALAASPGPDFFLITRNTLSYGRFIGYMTLVGNRISLCVHMTLAILGISLILQQCATLFLLIRLLGAGYLIYLGIGHLRGRVRSAATQPDSSAETPMSARHALCRGFLNNLLNPKVSLFFLSLFPQFTSPELLSRSPLAVATTFFVGNSTWWIPMVFLIGFAGVRAVFLRFQQALDRAFGLVFIGYGMHVLWEESTH